LRDENCQNGEQRGQHRPTREKEQNDMYCSRVHWNCHLFFVEFVLWM